MNNHNNKQSGGAGGVVAGALAGLAVGAAAVVLSKKENRKMIRTKVNKVLEMGEDKLDETRGQIDDMKKNATKRISQEAHKVGDRLDNLNPSKK